MADLLYRTSIYGPRRTVATLPWGDEVVRRTEITYHFYNIEGGFDAPMRAARAAKRIEKSGYSVIPLKGADADKIVSNILLGLVPETEPKATIRKGEANQIIENAISNGTLDAALPRVLDEHVLPFRESPLSGKTIKEITTNPTAIAVFIVITTKTSAPIAFVVLPVGIVAMHVALKAGPRIANWVDKKLKKWMK